MFRLTLLCLTGVLSVSAVADTYKNPILNMDMADPHVIRDGETYYLYATTHTKGYDVYTSRDLVNWTNRGLAFSSGRGGDWAPDVFKSKEGKYYLYYTSNGPEPIRKTKVVGVAVADSPLGKFVDKAIYVTNAIDAHLFQDDDGQLYFYYVDLNDGFKIMAQRMSDPLKRAGEPREVIRPTESWEKRSGHVTEGPFVLKRNGIYYLTYSGTGADSPNYGIGYATSDSPLGPFTKHQGNPIAQRGGKVLGPGHHSIVTGPDDKLWLVYHQKWEDNKSFYRFLAIDPIWFDDKGVLRTKVTRDEQRPAPVNNR